MAYATLADFNGRYATRLTDAEISSHVLPYGSARLETLLAHGFTVPFSNNNVTARDMALDLSYLLVLRRGKAPGDYKPLEEAVEKRIQALLEGREAMMTDGGQPLFSSIPRVWGSTSAFKPVFGLGDPLSQRVDPVRLSGEDIP
ncbi:MAG: hypothetical protein OEW12_05695 [Deltaproteobacteria bacterium]|nr:hypothetical protein [Deltaproteobacteria bacterium]